MTEDANGDQIIEHVSFIKLPPFWASKPEIWFAQIEAQFTLSRVTSDKTKYNLVIANLPFEIIANIYDVIANPPENNMYERIKNVLISRLSQSEEKRLDNLLSGSEMGEQKPSEFYRDMLSTVGGTQMVSEELLLKLWKRRLPKAISIGLVASGKENLNELLQIADKIWESINRQTYSYNQKLFEMDNFRSKQSTSSLMPKSHESELLKAFTELNISVQTILQKQTTMESDIASLKNHFYQEQQPQCCPNCHVPRHRSNLNFSHSSSRQRSSSGQRTSNSICYYHDKYRDKALKCEPWCLLYKSFIKKVQEGTSQMRVPKNE